MVAATKNTERYNAATTPLETTGLRGLLRTQFIAEFAIKAATYLIP